MSAQRTSSPLTVWPQVNQATNNLTTSRCLIEDIIESNEWTTYFLSKYGQESCRIILSIRGSNLER